MLEEKFSIGTSNIFAVECTPEMESDERDKWNIFAIRTRQDLSSD